MTVTSGCGGAPVVSMTVTWVIATADAAAAAAPANAAASAPHSIANALMWYSSRSPFDGGRLCQDQAVQDNVHEPRIDPHHFDAHVGAVLLVFHIADQRHAQREKSAERPERGRLRELSPRVCRCKSPLPVLYLDRGWLGYPNRCALVRD